jgi:hypothetical protein
MRIATRTRSWMEIVARTGYTAVAIVYLLLGALALRLALGNSRQAPDAQSAILEVGATSCGRFFLGLLAAGLVAFTIWRVVEAIFDPKHARSGLKSLVMRTGYLISGLSYAVLAYFGFDLISGGRVPSGGDSEVQGLAAGMLSHPMGGTLLFVIGGGIIVAGAIQFWEAYSAHFEEHFQRFAMNHDGAIWTRRAGQWGSAACGAVFCLIGIFTIEAAVDTNPHQSHGIAGALEYLMRAPHGPWLLGFVAAGLIAYGAFMLVVARYGDFPV